jgi:hypothetical protein
VNEFKVSEILNKGASSESLTFAGLPLQLFNLDGSWYWTIDGNGHCFGSFSSRGDALASATE